MNKTKTLGGSGTLELIVQLVTAGAVLVGIYFVMIELRQAREISTVEMVHTRLITNIEHFSKIYGENLAVTLAKACHSPEELDDPEVVALNKYFNAQMDQLSVAYTGAIMGSFQKGLGLVENWRLLSARYVQEVISYPSGRKWLRTHPVWGSGNRSDSQAELQNSDNLSRSLGNPMYEFVQSFAFKPSIDCSDLRNMVTPNIIKARVPNS